MKNKYIRIKGLAGFSVILISALARPGAFAQQADPVRTPDPPAVFVAADTTPISVGDALMIHQRYEAAIAAYKTADPNSADVWNKLGIANQLMLNPEEAIRCYRKSLKLNPKNANALNNLGTLYDSMKRTGDAQKMFRKSIAVAPNSPLAYKNLGTALMAQHDYKKGWIAYQKALALDPAIFRNHAVLHVENPGTAQDRGAMNYFMAKGCVRAGMIDCAIDHLRHALNEGFTNAKKIGADTEFAGLRGRPEFDELLASQGP
jgi:tetratricopeptide (TPR) repeat protein